MCKKRKIEIVIDFELHAPNLLSTYILKKEECRKSAQLNKLIIN